MQYVILFTMLKIYSWRRKLILLFSCLFLLAFSFPESSFAQVNTGEKKSIPVSYEAVNPKDGFSYTLKRLKEKVTLGVLFIWPQKKSNYYEKILNTRLAELKYVSDSKDLNQIENSTKRYAAAAGNYTEYILSHDNLKDSKNHAKDLLNSHLVEVDKYKNNFESTRAEWRFVEDDVNSLKILLTKLSQ